MLAAMFPDPEEVRLPQVLSLAHPQMITSSVRKRTPACNEAWLFSG